MKFDFENCTCREAALHFQALGYPITLCRGKMPVAIDWKDHRYSAAEIEAGFALDLKLNVGLILGRRSGLIDVEGDCGDQSERDMYDLMDGVFPDTPTFESRRGYHRLFAWDDRLAFGRSLLEYKSLSIRVGAGYAGAHTLLPPSVTDGVKREWRLTLDDVDGEIMQLPDFVIAKLMDAYHIARRVQDVAVEALS